MRTKKPWLTLLALLACLSLVAAACGDDEDDAGSAETTEATDTTAAEGGDTEPAEGDEPGTIVDVATENGSFGTLLTAVGAADPAIAEALAGEGPLTVFAPTDDAFAAVDETALTDLLADQPALTGVLQYHVVEGAVLSSDLTDGQEVTTLQGEILTIGVTDDGVTVTDAAGNTVNVVIADVEASNGVIHAIDGVLFPAG